jgi:hypothetical protein
MNETIWCGFNVLIYNFIWKILGGHKRKQQPNIEINTLYEFFKDLNTKGPDEQQSTTLQNELPNDSNVHINGYISQNEIFKCI